MNPEEIVVLAAESAAVGIDWGIANGRRKSFALAMKLAEDMQEECSSYPEVRRALIEFKERLAKLMEKP